MGCRRVSRRNYRAAAALLAGGLALAACTPTGDASPIPEPPEAAPAPSEDDAPAEPVDEPEPAEPTDEEAVALAYQAFLDGLTAAMEAGDPDLTELTEHAEGAGLVSAQAMVVSLTEAGRVARGEFVPSFESIEVAGDSASVEDCYRAELVEYDATTDDQVADRGGARYEASARLERVEDRWVVTEFVEGDVCAPAALAVVIEDRYLAFWDAAWDASDPADPDHRGLLETAAGDYLSALQAQLTQLQEAGHVRRGRGTENPVAVYLTDHDQAAVVRDCVEENPAGGVYDAASGELVDGGEPPGAWTLLEARLEIVDEAWKVADVRLLEEDSSCVPEGS
jgi:hypothetical protein